MLGMSQEKLASGLGLTFQQVQKYESGTNRIGEAVVDPSSSWRATTGKARQPKQLAKAGGRGWIRTTVGVSQRVYSASPLAARAPVRRARYIG
jgi:transcriptional regulator with XRE-family HTH domain